MFEQIRNTVWPGPAATGSPGLVHRVNGRSLQPPFPDHCAEILFGMGCFWGAERLFWTRTGVWVTAAGYAGGQAASPTYRQVCSGRTGHAEVVRVVFDPAAIPLAELLRIFWEGHDPTQGDRQGNDVGSQYRSAIYPRHAGHRQAAEASRTAYAAALAAAGHAPVTTEIRDGVDFHPAEAAHQQYLAARPGGYCGLGGTGIACPGAAGG